VTSPLRTYEGGCHCGALGFSFGTRVAVADWSLRACGCGFCRAHGGQTTSDPGGRLAFHVHEGELLQRYRFALMTADFLLCRRCGVYIGAQIAGTHSAFGIINTRALRPVPTGLPAAVVADYAAEGTSERVARREQRWTPLTRPV
jgi:hypothetical protein